MGRMQTDLLISRIKAALRFVLGPTLPLVRSIRTYPNRLRAKQIASTLRLIPGVSVCYLTSQFPARPALRTEFAHGGAVKLTYLAESFPHSFPKAGLLYVVSSIDHPGKTEIVQAAKNRGLKIIVNQNGVAYAGWHGPGWELPNKKNREIYDLADFVIFQSQFCRIGAETFLSKREMPSKVIFNPVDVDFFSPGPLPAHAAPVLLLGGNQFISYRFEVAAETFELVSRSLPGAKLIVTGNLWGESQLVAREQAQALLRKLGCKENVVFTGRYSQSKAASIFHSADILIHPKFMDPSPGLIGEALACGLPVVYSASGGIPEIVGPEAGIGVPVEASWAKINRPDPQKMSDAVITVWENYAQYSQAARQRAVEQLRLDLFTQAHQTIFSELVER